MLGLNGKSSSTYTNFEAEVLSNWLVSLGMEPRGITKYLLTFTLDTTRLQSLTQDKEQRHFTDLFEADWTLTRRVTTYVPNDLSRELLTTTFQHSGHKFPGRCLSTYCGLFVEGTCFKMSQTKNFGKYFSIAV